MARGGGDIDLQCQAAVFLEHLVVDVLDRLEPRHLGIVDVVRFVIEDGEFFDFPHDLAEVGFAVGGFSRGLRAEGIGEEIIAQVVVIQRWLGHVAEKDTVDVGEEDVSRIAEDTDVVLDVERELEIVAPVLTLVAVVGQDGVGEEDFQAVEVGAEAVENDDVRGDDEEVPGERGIEFVKFVEEAPRDEQGEDFCFSSSCRHL
jgi:hypothetical protein